MKKFFLVLSLIFISTNSFTKELDLGMHKINSMLLIGMTQVLAPLFAKNFLLVLV